MRRSIFILALCSLFLAPLMAQEAFYIYRNDGDFNGFFYDEVQEMRYSKIDLDSVEHDNYIMYEVQLADTLYRIPLAAIDSIGFQQPEIILNPNLRFIELEGWCPYITSLSDSLMVMEDIPAELAPQTDFVLVGLPTDSCNALYEELGGSYGLVVQSVSKDGNTTYVHGRPIQAINEIFEQFICLEQIGVDSLGNVHRRMAGRLPEGMHRLPLKEGGTSFDLVDLNGTFKREWQPGGDSSKVKVDLSADVNIKVRLRVAYDMRWYMFYAKISRDYQFRVKPSVGVTGTLEWKVSTDDLVKNFPPVLFPAACPLFEIKPFPALFMNVSGTIDARINLPQVYLGFGDDIIMNSLNVVFPVMYSMHLVPDETTEPTEDMLDASASLKFTGTIYTGIAFQAVINTNSYIRDIFQCGIGANFSIGPKVTGELSFSTNMLSSPNVYPLLSAQNLTMNFLSLGLDVTAKAKIGWGDDKETTFFSSSKDYFAHSMRLAPVFDATNVRVEPKAVDITLNPQPGIFFLYKKFDIALFDTDAYDSRPEPKLKVGDWDAMVVKEKNNFSKLVPFRDLKATTYYVTPYVYGPGGPFIVSSAAAQFNVPLEVDAQLDSIHASVDGGPSYTRTFTTNCPPEGVTFHPGFLQGDSLMTGEITVLDSVAGNYQLTCSALPNNRLFGDTLISVPAGAGGPYVRFDAGGEVADSAICMGFSQEGNVYDRVSVHFSGHFNGTLGNHAVVFNGHAKARRQFVPEQIVFIDDTIRNGNDSTVLHFKLTLDTIPCPECIGEHYYASGSIVKRSEMSSESFSFENAEGQKNSVQGNTGTVTGASYTYGVITTIDGNEVRMEYGNQGYIGDPANHVSIHIYPVGAEDTIEAAPKKQQ